MKSLSLTQPQTLYQLGRPVGQSARVADDPWQSSELIGLCPNLRHVTFKKMTIDKKTVDSLLEAVLHGLK